MNKPNRVDAMERLVLEIGTRKTAEMIVLLREAAEDLSAQNTDLLMLYCSAFPGGAGFDEARLRACRGAGRAEPGEAAERQTGAGSA